MRCSAIGNLASALSEGDLARLTGVLYGLGTIEQRERVAHRGDGAVVDDGDQVFALPQGEVPAHLLSASEQCVGRAGFVFGDDGIGGVFALAVPRCRPNTTSVSPVSGFLDIPMGSITPWQSMSRVIASSTGRWTRGS